MAATLAKGAAQQLHVLSVYDYPPLDHDAISPQRSPFVIGRISCGGQIPLWSKKLEAYVAPLHAEGVAVSPILRVGNPREVIVEVATT